MGFHGSSAGKESACNAGVLSSIPGSGRPHREGTLLVPTLVFLDFPGGLDSKECTCKEGNLGSTTGLGRSPRGGHGNLLRYSCLENSHGQRSLLGYPPRGHKGLDTTGQLSTVHREEIILPNLFPTP